MFIILCLTFEFHVQLTTRWTPLFTLITLINPGQRRFPIRTGSGYPRPTDRPRDPRCVRRTIPLAPIRIFTKYETRNDISFFVPKSPRQNTTEISLNPFQNTPSLYSSSSGRGSVISDSTHSHEAVRRANSSSMLLDNSEGLDSDLAILGMVKTAHSSLRFDLSEFLFQNRR